MLDSTVKSAIATAAVIFSVIALVALIGYFLTTEGPGMIYYSERGVDKIMHVQSYSRISSYSGRIVTDDGKTLYFQNIYEYYSDEYLESDDD